MNVKPSLVNSNRPHQKLKTMQNRPGKKSDPAPGSEAEDLLLFFSKKLNSHNVGDVHAIFTMWYNVVKESYQSPEFSPGRIVSLSRTASNKGYQAEWEEFYANLLQKRKGAKSVNDADYQKLLIEAAGLRLKIKEIEQKKESAVLDALRRVEEKIDKLNERVRKN